MRAISIINPPAAPSTAPGAGHRGPAAAATARPRLGAGRPGRSSHGHGAPVGSEPTNRPRLSGDRPSRYRAQISAAGRHPRGGIPPRVARRPSPTAPTARCPRRIRVDQATMILLPAPNLRQAPPGDRPGRRRPFSQTSPRRAPVLRTLRVASIPDRARLPLRRHVPQAPRESVFCQVCMTDRSPASDASRAARNPATIERRLENGEYASHTWNETSPGVFATAVARHSPPGAQ